MLATASSGAVGAAADEPQAQDSEKATGASAPETTVGEKLESAGKEVESTVEDEGDTGGALREQKTAGIEEITITGEVLESTTQAAPAAITTFDQEELDTLGISTVDTLALNTPSLHVGQVGQQAVITLRGIGLENLTSIGEAGVGFEIDDVHIGRPSAANLGFFDLERVDVLRGPQGQLGGRNLTAGRIALHSKKPTEDFDASSDVTLGNYDTIENRTVLNVPIFGQYLMTRGSLFLDRHNGYQQHLLVNNPDQSLSWFDYGDNSNTDDARDLGSRLQARSLLFDQTLEARGIFYYNMQRGNGPAVKLIGPPPDNIQGTYGQLFASNVPPEQQQENEHFIVPDCPAADVLVSPYACNPGDPRKTYQDTLQNRNNTWEGFTGHLTWDVPFWADTPLSDLQMKLIGSWQNIDAGSTTDFDGTNLPDTLFNLRRVADQTLVEAYVERADVDWFDFKAGVFYYTEHIDSDLCFDASGLAPFVDLGFQAAIDTESLAGYATVGFRPIPSLRIFGGARYTDETKSANQILERYTSINSPGQGGQPPADQGATRASRNGCARTLIDQINPSLATTVIRKGYPQYLNFKQTYTNWSPDVGVEWQVTEDSSLSFKAVNGFKAGGFPLAAEAVLNPELSAPYDSEQVWSFELTSKNELVNGLLRLNTTLFWTEYDPFQICQFSGPIFFCRSDGSATIRGVEVEWIANPIEGLQLNGFFNYVDSRINNYQIIDPTTRSCEAWLQQGSPTQYDKCIAGTGPTTHPTPPLPTDVSGNQLPKAPAWAGSFGVQYTLDFGRWGYFTPRFQTQFQGQTYFRVFNKSEFSQQPYAKYDFKVMWRSEDDRFKAEAFVYNLTDEAVINSMFIGPQATGGQVLAQYQEPRTFGIQFGINYVSDWLDKFF